MNEKKIYCADDICLAQDPASEAKEAKQEQASDKVSQEVKSRKIPFEVSEVPEMRGKNRKVYRMSDGSEKAVFYPTPIHVFDMNTNRFEEVHNLLTDDDGRHLCSTQSRFKASFSKEVDNDELFTIENESHRITVLVGDGVYRRSHGAKPTLNKKAAIDTVGIGQDIASFTGVFENSDLDYFVMENGVKEDIVVRERAATYRYSFVLLCENIVADYCESKKTVAFKDPDTKQTVFVIPAPIMCDLAGSTSTAVDYEIREIEEHKIALTVVADSDWINAEDRVFPVVIDPQITVKGGASMSSFCYNGSTVVATNSPMVSATKEMYLRYMIPTLPANVRIKKAEITVTQECCANLDTTSRNLAIYHVTEDIVAGGSRPMEASVPMDYAPVRSGSGVTYTFDITSQVDRIQHGETTDSNLMLTLMGENNGNLALTFCGASHSTAAYRPIISITYENHFGINTAYRTHTHEIGRFGQGSIDLQCGNLMFESEDFVWTGNRMPVTIKHLYNSALADYQYTQNAALQLNTANFGAMKLGYGWKLNLMQSIKSVVFQHEGVQYSGYVFIDENGDETYFKQSTTQQAYDKTNSVCYYLYEDVNGGETYYDNRLLELTMGGEVYSFDTAGRLICVTDEYGNYMMFTYTSNRLTSIRDGARRTFTLTYNSGGFLTSITAPDNNVVTYTYSGNLLSGITYPDGRMAVITYSANRPTEVTMKNASGGELYRVEYTYSHINHRVATVKEYGETVLGASTAYSYSAAAGRTIVATTEPKDTEAGETTDNVIYTVYSFDDDGNVISEYAYTTDSDKSASSGVSEEGGINPHSGEGGAGIVCNIDNLLIGHAFNNLTRWTSEASNCSDTSISIVHGESIAKFGTNALRMESCQFDGIRNGVYQVTNQLPAGTYTLSAYIRIVSAFQGGTSPGAYIRVTDSNNNQLAISDKLSKVDSEYVRLNSTFTLNSAQSVVVHIQMDGKGVSLIDAAQLESNSYASAYNMLENGHFERSGSDDNWVQTRAIITNNSPFNMAKSLEMNGGVATSQKAYQEVIVKSAAGTRETFTLSGWAKGYAFPQHARVGRNDPIFELRAEIHYVGEDEEVETVSALFSPSCVEWQLASVQFAKNKYKAIDRIRVYCDFSYNNFNACFDDIQLVRNSIETGLSKTDIEGEAVSDDETEDTTEDTTTDFAEVMDDYGNVITETTFTEGQVGTIYRSFAYSNGNDLVRETDPRGYKTFYDVDSCTSRNTQITDRCGNRTAYEYDENGRVTKVTSKNSAGTSLANVSYAYDNFDNMTDIIRGDGMKYSLIYNNFHNLESIGINGKTEKLISYTYKNGNGRLKQMTYANGHTMKATYNSFGQMIGEVWLNASGVEMARYKYGYDGTGNLSRSIDIHAQKEYNYEYDEGRIVRATEFNIVLSGEIVTQKTLVYTIRDYYDSQGQLSQKTTLPAGGSAFSYNYIHTDNATSVHFAAGGSTVTSLSVTDHLGRKTSDELQLGTGTVTRQFSYHAGAVTSEHIANGKQKSTATTQLVSKITFSNGRTISYEYDGEESITKVIDSVDGTTVYTYDALGQLLTETVNGVVVNTMTYDNYGNIRTKNGKTYAYDSTWKDLLTSYNGQSITYDAQGNPTSYLGHTLTWEKGRQLKSFDSNTYTYNANGIRTSKTVNGIKHTYTLDGAKILRESWGVNVIDPLYDNEDSVCGILYNRIPYYFMKNLQGDVIAITDCDGDIIVKYSYDAWGVPTIKSDTSGCSLATVNPFRYRGYYYDAEIGMYYLQSRYYNPSTGRFINEDSLLSCDIDKRSLVTNAFVYSTNNPINESDYAGNIPWKKIGEVLLGAFMGGASQYISDVCQNLSECVLKNYKITNNIWNFRSGIGSYAISVVSGALDAALNIGIWKTIGLTIVTTVVKHLVDWLTGKGFSIVALIEEIVWKIFLALVMKSLTKKFSPKQGKKMNQYIRQKYKVKGTVAYRQKFKEILKSFSKKMTYLSTLVDTIKSSCQLFLDFLKQAIFDCIIKGLNEKYA